MVCPLLGQVDLKDVDSLFDSWDVSKDGSLEIGEITRVLQPAELQTESKNKSVMRRELSKRGSSLGAIDLKEDSDLPVQQQLREALVAQAVRVVDLFKEWDENGDGTVSKEEFRKAMPMLGLDVSREEIDALFDEWDPDGSGLLEYKELNTLLKRRE